MNQNDENGYTQAIAQADSVAAMVAAFQCDYDRLEELKDEKESLVGYVEEADDALDGTLENHDELVNAQAALGAWEAENAEELAELLSSAGDCADEDQARERITDDALDVQVRSAWHSPGEDAKADEFMILLCTGGPAVRIMGELDEHMQPCRAWIEYQDWFKPWQELSGHIDMSTLLTYCQQYYFGE